MVSTETKRWRPTHKAMINMDRSRRPFTARAGREGRAFLLLLSRRYTYCTITMASWDGHDRDIDIDIDIDKHKVEWGLPKK